MELAAALRRAEWIRDAGEGPALRMVFRPDGTGYYEREAAQMQRFVRERFLYRVEGPTLHLKFARAREWTEVGAALRAGPPAGGGEPRRFGAQELTLTRDPYAWAMEDAPSGELRLLSDTGPALPS